MQSFCYVMKMKLCVVDLMQHRRKNASADFNGTRLQKKLSAMVANLTWCQLDQDRIESTLQTKQSIKMKNFRDVNQNGIKNPASEVETSVALGAGSVLGFDLVHGEENLKRLIQHIAGDPFDRSPPPRLLIDLRYQGD